MSLDVLILSAVLLLGSGPERPLSLVVCAPGYPGDTEQAQPTMDALARELTRAGGWSEGRMRAVYDPTLEGGLERLAGADLALVPLPLYLAHGRRARLSPLLEVQHLPGPAEVWGLAARRGALKGPASLAGWEVASPAGYVPGFVRAALAGWGELPAEARIRFAPRVLSELRRAAAGERVAVLLDRAQTDALGALPFAGELEVVARSGPLPGSLLCSVGDRLDAEARRATAEAFLALGASEGGREVMATMRVSGFRRLAPDALDPVERAFRAEDGGGDAGP